MAQASPPIRGDGELSQEFLQHLRMKLDNTRGFEGSWRQFACLLLNCSQLILENFDRLSGKDHTGVCSQTNEVYKEFCKRKGTNVDIAAIWTILHDGMGREDLAREMEEFYHRGKLLCDPDAPSVYEIMANDPPGTSHSLATGPAQEGSDVCSVRNEHHETDRARQSVDQLTVHANTIIINGPLPDSGLSPVSRGAARRDSTETTSLGSTSSGSSSSLPRDSDSRDPPIMVDLRQARADSCQGRRENVYEVVPRKQEKVLISYADHDQQKAEDIALHLQVNGFDAILDNGSTASRKAQKHKCKQIFVRACAIVVVYSKYYRQEIMAKKGNGRNTRYIYQLLHEQYKCRRSNESCVFYPMYRVERGMVIPRIFNHLPSEPSARQVYDCLFAPIDQARGSSSS